MQAIAVRRLGEPPSSARLYLDGKRVSRRVWDESHLGRRTDSHCSRMEDRKDGSVLVREFHCIRLGL